MASGLAPLTSQTGIGASSGLTLASTGEGIWQPALTAFLAAATLR